MSQTTLNQKEKIIIQINSNLPALAFKLARGEGKRFESYLESASISELEANRLF